MSRFRGDSARVIGIRIGKIRDELGLTLEEFGKKVEPIAHKSNVNKWESGISKPSSERCKKIAELGNMTVGELLGTNSNKTVEEEINDIKNNFSDEEIKEIILKLI